MPSIASFVFENWYNQNSLKAVEAILAPFDTFWLERKYFNIENQSFINTNLVDNIFFISIMIDIYIIVELSLKSLRVSILVSNKVIMIETFYHSQADIFLNAFKSDKIKHCFCCIQKRHLLTYKLVYAKY